MNSALKCTLIVAIGVVAFALPAMAGVNTAPATMPEPGTIMLLAGGLATVIGARKFWKK
ncbi:MAG TPA: PEP-CTERM sorting domain-containing protein [Candidatus Acidoferrales bacterium]